jgi:hypothetical protein
MRYTKRLRKIVLLSLLLSGCSRTLPDAEHPKVKAPNPLLAKKHKETEKEQAAARKQTRRPRSNTQVLRQQDILALCGEEKPWHTTFEKGPDGLEINIESSRMSRDVWSMWIDVIDSYVKSGGRSTSISRDARYLARVSRVGEKKALEEERDFLRVAITSELDCYLSNLDSRDAFLKDNPEAVRSQWYVDMQNSISYSGWKAHTLVQEFKRVDEKLRKPAGRPRE